VVDDLGEVFGLALAIAASPFPVIPAILLLFTARPRPTSLAFLGGWLVGIGVVTGAFALLAGVVKSGGDSPTWLSWVRVAAGAILAVYGILQWTSRNESHELPRWMRSIQDATPARGLRLALLLSVANPKVLLLAAAAGLDIGAAQSTAAGTVLAAVLFTLVASISVAAPVLAYAVAGPRVLPPLEKAKDWLTRNNAAVMAVVIIAIGLALLKNGLGGI
jgi:threonine/homoserine/homoserine lactone efflux protein